MPLPDLHARTPCDFIVHTYSLSYSSVIKLQIQYSFPIF